MNLNLIFWICVSILVYIYIGYILLLKLISLLIKPYIHKFNIPFFPNITLIVPVYNEEKIIKSKIENLLKLKYPFSKLEILIGSDSSTDRTDNIIKSYLKKGIRLVKIKQRVGPTSVCNILVEKAKNKILVFTDATSLLKSDALLYLISHFLDKRVGCVSGNVVCKNLTKKKNVEWFHLSYISLLRKLEGVIGAQITASGGLYAIRKKLFKQLLPSTDLDFITPLQIRAKGFLSVYESKAICFEYSNSKFDFEKRLRTSVRGYQSLFNHLIYLNIFKYGFVSVQLFSHKLLRWLTPIFLMIIYILNIFLVNQTFFKGLFLFQNLFYSLVIFGFFSKILILNLISYFYFIHMVSFIAFIKYLCGYRCNMWNIKR